MKAKVMLAQIIMIVLLLIPFPALGQDNPVDIMKFVREKALADKKLLIAEEMRFTESEAKGFWLAYDSYQQDMDKIIKRSIDLIQYYEKNYNSMTNEAAKKLLADTLAIESDRIEIRKKYVPIFGKSLSDKRLAKFYQLENKIHAIVSDEVARHIPLMK